MLTLHLLGQKRYFRITQSKITHFSIQKYLMETQNSHLEELTCLSLHNIMAIYRQ